MTYLQHLPLELIEAILKYLRPRSLRATIRTAKFLRTPGERKLYSRVFLPIDRFATKRLWKIQVRFLNTVLENDRLAQHVVKLVLGDSDPSAEGDAQINHVLGQAMEKMINLKQLKIFGHPYIVHAHLDCVPFSLTHLFISGERFSDTAPVPELIPILRAHPNLEELAVDCMEFPPDLVLALKEEQQGLVPESGILCPRLKRFDGYDEGLRLLLPMRKIRSGTALVHSGANDVDNDSIMGLWLTPVLISSYQYLRVLEVWPNHGKNPSFLVTIAPFLTSLTHLQILDDILSLHPQHYLLHLLCRLPALESITLTTRGGKSLTLVTSALQDVVRLVHTVCPNISKIYVGGEAPLSNVVYYGYDTKGQGVEISLVSQEVACRPYARWILEYLDGCRS